MCNNLRTFGAANRRDQHAFVMAAARAAAARDMREQAARRIISGEAERIHPLSAAVTSQMSPHATAVADAFRS